MTIYHIKVMNYAHYLLQTDNDIAAFRVKYSEYIASHKDGYVSWISKLSARSWTDFLGNAPEGAIPVIIGTLCILYLDKIIDIEFNSTATMIRRMWTKQEWQEYYPFKGKENDHKK